MPRKPRIDLPGLIHHIILRGNNRQTIFLDDKDRYFFLKTLGNILEESKTKVFAWCLMPNHIHILLLIDKCPMQQIMRRLCRRYVHYFNMRHKRFGHLFQGRYKSIICNEEEYFLKLVAYIHLNPLHAKLLNDVQALKHFSFSGHQGLMGKRRHPWQNYTEVLSRFSINPDDAANLYEDYIAGCVDLGKRPDLEGDDPIHKQRLKLQEGPLKQQTIIDSRFLSDNQHIVNVLQRVENEGIENFNRKPLDVIIRCVASEHNLKADHVLSRSRNRLITAARHKALYIAAIQEGYSITDLAKYFRISLTAVSKGIARVKNSKV